MTTEEMKKELEKLIISQFDTISTFAKTASFYVRCHEVEKAGSIIKDIDYIISCVVRYIQEIKNLESLD